VVLKKLETGAAPSLDRDAPKVLGKPTSTSRAETKKKLAELEKKRIDLRSEEEEEQRKWGRGGAKTDALVNDLGKGETGKDQTVRGAGK